MRFALAVMSSVALLGGMGTVGCSTPPKPAQEIEKAELAIRTADVDAASSDASLELRLAREKVELAKSSLRDDEYDQARRYAEQALVDAQLAEAKAQSDRARASASELEETIGALRSEAARGMEVQP